MRVMRDFLQSPPPTGLASLPAADKGSAIFTIRRYLSLKLMVEDFQPHTQKSSWDKICIIGAGCEACRALLSRILGNSLRLGFAFRALPLTRSNLTEYRGICQDW